MADDIRVGLMGFGRIGRNVFRQLRAHPDVDVRAIVDVADPQSLAYLLKFDTIYGRFPEVVELNDTQLLVGGSSIPIVAAAEPGDVDWADFGVEVVIQATGKYRTAEWCRRHLEAGAARVILASTPEEPGDIPILLCGVNDEVLTPGVRIIALGSNTSNALAPILETFDREFGLEHAFFTTVHAFTNQERLADVPSPGMRSSRAAGENIIPGDTNSPQILEQVLPQLRGKLEAMALNVPVPDGSAIDLTATVSRATTVEEVNKAIEKAAAERFPGIIAFLSDPIVSSDVVGHDASGVYDGLATMVMDGTMVKAIVWFDNGWGYSARIVETIKRMKTLGPVSEEVGA